LQNPPKISDDHFLGISSNFDSHRYFSKFSRFLLRFFLLAPTGPPGIAQLQQWPLINVRLLLIDEFAVVRFKTTAN